MLSMLKGNSSSREMRWNMSRAIFILRNAAHYQLPSTDLLFFKDS